VASLREYSSCPASVCGQAESRERAKRSAPMIRICVRHRFCRQVPLGMQIGGSARVSQEQD